MEYLNEILLSLNWQLQALLDVLALDHRTEGVTELFKGDLGDLLRAHTRDITVSNRILSQDDVVAELGTLPSGRRHANMSLTAR